MFQLRRGDRIALCGLSDPLVRTERNEGKIEHLREILGGLGLETALCPGIFADERGDAGDAARARAWMNCCLDETIRAVFDVSGGDESNGVLEYLDYEAIRERNAENPVAFFGYSDLTAVLNALYAKAGMRTGLYQIRNLAGSAGEVSRGRFARAFLEPGMSEVRGAGEVPVAGEIPGAPGSDRTLSPITRFSVRMVRGSGMEGTLVGGNIRCFLKLAGTPYMPDIRGKILFLESNGGDRHRTAAAFSQLRQMGVFDGIAGLLLGTFTALDREMGRGYVCRLACEAAGELPVAVTDEIGHGEDSACLVIGGYYRLHGGEAEPERTIKNIVFDMGRVLLDYDPVRVCYEYTGDEADVEAMREALFSSPEWILLDRGDITEEAAMEIVRERLPDERLKKMADDCMAHWHEYNICPKEGMYDVVRELKEAGYRIYLCSNASLRLRVYEHRIPGIGYFDGTLVSAEEHCIKPEPAIYRRLFEKFDIRPEESFFIDDVQANIDGARACGMDGYCFADGDVGRLKKRLEEVTGRKLTGPQ